jgi:undecaprenyl diphosphate synthase
MSTEFPSGIHVAIIMDGNGRWATRRGLPRVAGHRAGVAAARRIVEHAPEVGIRRLTLYAFSSDNWRRPPAEVERIFWLLRAFLRLQTARLREQGVRLQAIGRRDRLPQPVLRAIETAERATANGGRLDLRVAIDYSAREAIARAAAMAAARAHTPDALGAAMRDILGGGGGDVDLLIRTGGEQRLSDFLLWETAYAELYFTDCTWPDFDAADLDAALAEFRRRERRFGAVPESAVCVRAAVNRPERTKTGGYIAPESPEPAAFAS